MKIGVTRSRGLSTLLMAYFIAQPTLLQASAHHTQSSRMVVSGVPVLASVAAELPRTPVAPSSKPIKPKLPNTPKAIKDKTLTTLQDSVDKSVSATELLQQKLDTLTPILDQNGNVLLNEVLVENQHRAIQYEWIATLPTTILNDGIPEGVIVIKQSSLSALALETVHFTVKPEWDSLAALKTHLPPAWTKNIDRNHVYFSQKKNSVDATNIDDTLNNPPKNKVTVCDAKAIRVGMIDTDVATDHLAFASKNIIQRSFVPKTISEPTSHGTSVASILLGVNDSTANYVPAIELYAASAFYARNDYTQGATIDFILQGLNWLAESNVSVINMSLTGPDNRLLKLAIDALNNRDIFVVAAVGNHGPAAPKAYPAGYDSVIGVTAVDNQRQVYRWANQGDHVDLSAFGVNVNVARSDNSFGRETGTSLAAPMISRWLACQLTLNTFQFERLQNILEGSAVDLGEKGKDSVFGFGLIH